MTFTMPDWPMFGLSDDIRPTLKGVMAAGQPSALVTLYAVEGGGPRPPGAQMLFSDEAVSGFLSGGCVEGDVAIHAAQTLADGEPRHLIYGEGGPWPDIRLLCGARIELLVERIAADDVAATALLTLMDQRRPAVWITDGRTRRVEPGRLDDPACVVDQPFSLRRGYEPTLKLIVVGSDPTAIAIAALGGQIGFETHLVRPKGPLTAPVLAGVRYARSDPAEALAAIGVDAWTAVAVATHDWDIDQATLDVALPSAAPYVGVLGARRRLPERLARLRAAGIAERLLKRLRAPIGLDLGGKAPWEVAVAVIGQIVAERAGAWPSRVHTEG